MANPGRGAQPKRGAITAGNGADILGRLWHSAKSLVAKGMTS
jgi:hypothetical protein